MMKIFLTVLIALFLCYGISHSQQEKQTGFTMNLQADTGSHEGLARALHALLYAEELLQGGYSVVLIFDGAGTT